MKNFRTELGWSAQPFLSHDHSILTLGSCFAEHVGKRLLDFKWKGLNAPFGTLFHPLALEKVLRLAIEHKPLERDLFVEHDGAYFHHDLHSQFYAQSPDALTRIWQKTADEVRACLQTKPLLLLTLGTAFVYELKSSGKMVANCHKQLSSSFQKRLLTLEEINGSLQGILQLLPKECQVIASLSPVRHTRDTLILNSVSKSLLRMALYDWSQSSSERITYFPAYEIMMDDLRDYRFYERDGVHPNAEAIEYIWDKFIGSYMNPDALAFMDRWQPIRVSLLHRPQRLEAPSYQRFIGKILAEMEEFKNIELESEKKELQSRLI